MLATTTQDFSNKTTHRNNKLLNVDILSSDLFRFSTFVLQVFSSTVTPLPLLLLSSKGQTLTIAPLCFCLSRGWGFCLDDRPSKRDLTTPLARLGVRYTTHHQCQLQYGPNATFCHEVDVSIVHQQKAESQKSFRS